MTEDFEDCEMRDQHGYPPLAKVTKNTAPVTASQTIDASHHNNNALPWLVLVAVTSCSLAGAAIGLAIGAKAEASKAERETRLMRLEIDEMKVALQTQGIKIHEGYTP